MRLVRATHEHRIAPENLRQCRREFSNAEIMGGPDKPGHDESSLSSMTWLDMHA